MWRFETYGNISLLFLVMYLNFLLLHGIVTCEETEKYGFTFEGNKRGEGSMKMMVISTGHSEVITFKLLLHIKIGRDNYRMGGGDSYKMSCKPWIIAAYRVQPVRQLCVHHSCLSKPGSDPMPVHYSNPGPFSPAIHLIDSTVRRKIRLSNMTNWSHIPCLANVASLHFRNIISK